MRSSWISGLPYLLLCLPSFLQKGSFFLVFYCYSKCTSFSLCLTILSSLFQPNMCGRKQFRVTRQYQGAPLGMEWAAVPTKQGCQPTKTTSATWMWILDTWAHTCVWTVWSHLDPGLCPWHQDHFCHLDQVSAEPRQSQTKQTNKAVQGETKLVQVFC